MSKTRWSWVMLAGVIAAGTWLSSQVPGVAFERTFPFAAGVLGVIGAFLNADALIGRRLERSPKIDWLGTFAILIGLAGGAYLI